MKTLLSILLLLIVACKDPGNIDKIEDPAVLTARFYEGLLGDYTGICIYQSTDYFPMTGQIITTRDTSNNATLRVDSIVNESVYYEAFCSNDIFTSLGLNGEFEIKDTIEFGTGGGRYFEYITFYPLEKKVTTYSASYTTSPANSKSYGTFYKVE